MVLSDCRAVDPLLPTIQADPSKALQRHTAGNAPLVTELPVAVPWALSVADCPGATNAQQMPSNKERPESWIKCTRGESKSGVRGPARASGMRARRA